MNKAQVEYQRGGSDVSPVFINWTDKAEPFEKIAIKGVKWDDRHNNTYHKAYISGLNKSTGVWEEIGQTEIHAGYGDHYTVTAGEWLARNGYLIETEDTNGYCLGSWYIRESLGIEHHSQTVKRQRDM